MPHACAHRPRHGRELTRRSTCWMGASDVSQPRAGGPRAAPCQLLRSRPLPERARARAGGPHAGGMDERARSERRTTRAPAPAGSPCARACELLAADSSAGAPARRASARADLQPGEPLDARGRGARRRRAPVSAARAQPTTASEAVTPCLWTVRPARSLRSANEPPHGPRPSRRGSRGTRRSRRAGRQRSLLGGRSIN